MGIGPSAAAVLDEIVALWKSCDLAHPANDLRRDIERKLADSAWGFLVAVDGNVVVGSIMAGYDGHRGWINYLACDPDRRREGIATALMGEARRLLLERGCPKAYL